MSKSFLFGGRTFNYYFTRGWEHTERIVEVSLGHTFLREHSEAQALEVGNVMWHHSRHTQHAVIDLHEKAPPGRSNYANADVLEWEPDWTPSAVLSLSTLEHVHGHSEWALQRCLSWSAHVLVTMPLGYPTHPPHRPDPIVSKQLDAEVYVLQRTGQREWREIPKAEFLAMDYADYRYNSKFPCANMLGVWLKGGMSSVSPPLGYSPA